MLSLDDISVQFGGRSLFDGLSLMIGAHDRLGLVGSNGTGKSTLLKIIAGINQPESGRISKARYVTVGYLPQDGVIASGKSLHREVESAFEDIITVQNEIDDAHRKMESLDPAGEEYQDTLEIYGELQHKLEDLDAFRMKSKIERVLMGLGFSVPDFERQTDEFSGGWQMRIALAKLLLREPSLLLLDEPTNHLDIDSLQWLEAYLHGYNGAIILVSHDRALLDSLTQKTLSLTMGRFEIYSGNYSFYESEKIVRKEQQLNAFKNQQRQLAQTERFIERFRYKATKARQVQSRVKQLEKIERIEIENDEEEIRFHFPQPQPSGAVVMELRGICKSYGEMNLFRDLSFTVERGDRIAVVGVNGSGKSTFVKILAGVEPFQRGELKTGHGVVPSYFGQHQAEELDLTKDVLGTVDDVAVGDVRTKLRGILGSFLFHGDDVFKTVSVLSGGEKSRLALAKMLLQPANFLIMDEPTNHLDMRSKKVLQDALSAYTGTYAIVSHDRAFLDPIINKVVEFNAGKIRTFAGNISEYIEKIQAERAGSREGASTSGDPKADAVNDVPSTGKERKRTEAERRNRLYKLLLPYREELKILEAEISRTESRLKEIAILMSEPDFYKMGDGAKEISREERESRNKLEGIYSRWADLNEIIDEIEDREK